MTRPGHIMVELPVEEAEALVRLCEESGQVGRIPVRIQRPTVHTQAAFARLKKAITIERGTGGSCPAPEKAQV